MMADERNKARESVPYKTKEPRTGDQKKRKPGNLKQLPPNTVTKLVLEAFAVDPAKLLDLSPQLFAILSKHESLKDKFGKSYFQNYVTEREFVELTAEINSLGSKENINKEDAVRALELIASVGVHNQASFRRLVCRCAAVLGISLDDEKDASKLIKRGETAHRIEILRGLIVGVDWGGALLEVSTIGKDVRIRKSAEHLVGCISLGRDFYPEAASGKKESSIADPKAAIIDQSALFRILDRDAPGHWFWSSEFLRLVDIRCMIICPMETLLDTLTRIPSTKGSEDKIFKNLVNTIQIKWNLSSLKMDIFQFALSEACCGLPIAALYPLVLSKLTGLPLLTADSRIRTAFDEVSLEAKLKRDADQSTRTEG